MLSIVSIDVGLRNLGICKENYPIDSLKKCNHPKHFYDNTGKALPDMERFVNDIGVLGQLIYWERKDLGDKTAFHSQTAFINLIDWLDNLSNIGFFDNVNAILIEQQMKTNNIAMTLMHHIHCYLLIKFKKYKIIILYPSKNKTRVLGASLTTNNKDGKLVKTTKYNRKVWSVKLISKLLENRKDDNSLNILKKEKKKDDLCDTVAQALSYVILEVFKLEKTIPKHTPIKRVKKLIDFF